MEKNHCSVLCKTQVPVDFPVSDGKFASFPIYLRKKINKTNKQNYSVAGFFPTVIFCFQNPIVGVPVNMPHRWLTWVLLCQRERAKGEAPFLSPCPLSGLPPVYPPRGNMLFQAVALDQKGGRVQFFQPYRERTKWNTHTLGKLLPTAWVVGPQELLSAKGTSRGYPFVTLCGFHPKPQAKQWEMSIKETIFHSAKKKKWLDFVKIN